MKKREEDFDAEFEEEEDVASQEPEEITDLVTVAQARNMKEARAMKSILESAEITAFIGQEEAAALPPNMPGPGIPILVPEGTALEAEEILAEAAMSADEDEDLDEEDWDIEEEDEEEEDEDYLDDLEDEEDEDFDEDEDLDDLDEDEDDL